MHLKLLKVVLETVCLREPGLPKNTGLRLLLLCRRFFEAHEPAGAVLNQHFLCFFNRFHNILELFIIFDHLQAVVAARVIFVLVAATSARVRQKPPELEETEQR